ncbi:MAG: hypothetical protein H7338_21415 [Candidatus Sericytochromatia bacterium]|nr:hypothetical protein [Candidatus Sericytochromatia bacterium]
MNASITASASSLVVMHLFEKLETDGHDPIPTVAPGAAAPIRAGPTRHGHAHPVKDAPPKVDPPPMPTAPPLSLPMRELPKTHEAPAAIRQRAEAALNSYITDQSKADGDHSLTREQRQRAEGQRQNEIRQAADSAAQRYVTSLDSAQAQKQVVRKDAEIATVATVQTSDGQTQTVVVDRANRVHYDEPQAAG